MRACPACRASVPASNAFSVSEDGEHMVVGLCSSCDQRAARLAPGLRTTYLTSVAEIARRTPEKYLVASFPDAGAAELSAAMVRHPRHRAETLQALGWADDA